MGNIFNQHFLNDFIDSFRRKLSEEVDSLEITESTNIIQLVDQLKTKYTIEPLVLMDPIPSKPWESTRERQYDRGEKYKQKVFVIDIVIPFNGNYELFNCHPSTSTVIYLDENVQISSHEVKTKIILEDLDPIKYNIQLGKFISDLSANIPKVNEEISPWNNGLENHIKQLIELRKGIVSKKFDFMEKIGLNINPKSDDFMIPSPIKKRTIPTPASETTMNVKKEVVPILQEEVYKDIKDVIYNVGKAIERKPSIYDQKCEEDLRDILLLFLETRYDSTSGTGEAFNRKGKTDILLKYSKDGTNLFVAECKFWRGPKRLHDGLNQLIGYLTHRDSKTALILFVDQKEFSTVVTTLKNEIIMHPQFKRHIGNTYEHSLSYEFVLPDDSQKIIQIEVILFHFPKI
jgi:hypothetical protein